MARQHAPDGPWVLEVHPGGKNKMLSRAGEHGYYYFPNGPETVTDAICGRLNALEAENTSLRALLKELVDGAARDEGEGGFSLWADIDGYEWLTRVEDALNVPGTPPAQGGPR